MGLYSSMRTSASGMNAQSNRISSVADNIANSNTTGYKRSAIEFSTLVLAQGGGDYQSGSVNSQTQYFITQQGSQLSSSRWSNASINGDGMFVVQNAGGQSFFTRAGAFAKIDGTGYLENTAGMRLMGYPIVNGVTPPVTVNGLAGLQQINLSSLAQASQPTTSGYFKANLPINQDDGVTPTVIVAAGNRPSANAATATPTKGPSPLVAIDNVGNEVTLDVYVTKTGANTWEVAVYNKASRGAGASFFPYSTAALASNTFTFNSTGALVSPPSSLTLTVPNGQSATIDFSNLSALNAPYSPTGDMNGSKPSDVSEYQISEDGTLYAIYDSGDRVATFKIPLATVPSPDRLSVQPGNVFSTTQDSGDFSLGYANEGGRGTIDGFSLEQSNVDLANELTNMIEAQRNYTANSKVFQTSAELMDVLVNLSR